MLQGGGMRWVIVVIRLPAGPSRHRVAIWRELRHLGAHTLERLRRWWRDLKARDAFSLPEATGAEQRLKGCEQLLDDYADRVYQAVHQPLGPAGDGGDA